MSLTKTIARATRAIHSFGIRLHCKALNSTVKAADRSAKRATARHEAAQAVTNTARVLEQEAKGAAHKARTVASCIGMASREEARRIGGSL
ncbi:hypothetical protein LMG3458_02473 [Achromobacter deleyi]|uniref:Uncharacterized protein n=1 Tax=Achromobacter deleyi TaxID=1353891 RepID=A0A6S7A1W1_9BURK|nr:hypothetical protein [Achromobacter deleyi]CAB3697625.1 hypothetical protein LMG3458_02473 [Achromobacter deleyi]